MKRYISLLAILTAIAALLCGCSLARSDMDASAASRGRLIGVYITTEYIDLFDLEGYIGANASALSGGSIGEADAAQYNGRLYAELVDERYVFPGMDGFAFFMATTEHEYGTSYSNYSGEGVCGCKIAVNTNDNEDSHEEALELECTIYGLTGRNDRHVIYTNPVYQTADGEVYLTSGHGISTSGVGAGALVSQKLTDSTTVTDSEGNAATSSASVNVHYVIAELPLGYTLIEMDADSREITRHEYAPGELPPEYTANNSTAYIIVESRTASGSTYALYSAENTDIVTYAELKEKGVLTEKHTYVTFASNEADNA